MQIFHEVSSIKFRRSTRPKQAVGIPEVIGYFDGSDDAFAAVIYLRWALQDGSFDVNLECSKGAFALATLTVIFYATSEF